MENDETASWQATHARMGWSNDLSSCHIDSWLMCELAMDANSPGRWTEDLEWSAHEMQLRLTVKSLGTGVKAAILFRDNLRRCYNCARLIS